MLVCLFNPKELAVRNIRSDGISSSIFSSSIFSSSIFSSSIFSSSANRRAAAAPPFHSEALDVRSSPSTKIRQKLRKRLKVRSSGTTSTGWQSLMLFSQLGIEQTLSWQIPNSSVASIQSKHPTIVRLRQHANMKIRSYLSPLGRHGGGGCQ